MEFKKLSDKVTNYLLDDDFRRPFLVLILTALTSIISLISAIPHIVDDVFNKGEWVMAAVLSFTFVFSTGIFLLTFFDKKHHRLYSHLMMILITLLFGYCCWDGGPQGFIHLWILLVPSFSFVVFGIYEGFITAIPTFIIMLLFFWSPLHQFSKFPNADYPTDLSVDFRLRMTLVYLVGLVLGFIAELLRHVAAKRLKYFNKHFEYASLHDSLTGLANQNYLAKYLENIYENKDKHENLGCLFIDVDAFKTINDKYGHLFGNAVLIKVAEIFNADKNVFACRWGGDEFVICLVNVSEDYLIRVAEKFRATVSAVVFPEYPSLHVTISVGAVILPIDDSFNFDHVLDLADSANRSAKKKGKDNVSLAD